MTTAKPCNSCAFCNEWHNPYSEKAKELGEEIKDIKTRKAREEKEKKDAEMDAKKLKHAQAAK